MAHRSYAVHPNVSRVDDSKSHGYLVRFTRQDSEGTEKQTTKFFSDAAYGKRRAQLQAIQWREQKVKALKRNDRAEAHPPGYSYIKRREVTNYSQGVRYTYLAWEAFLRIEKRRHLITRWSIEKWGEKVAKQRCQEWLRKKTRELELRLRGSNGAAASGAPPATRSTRASPARAARSATPQTPAQTPARAKSSFPCGACGGVVGTVTGAGRKFEYRPHVKGPIPKDFPTSTCQTCGEHYLTSVEYEKLCAVLLEQEKASSKKKKVRRKAKRKVSTAAREKRAKASKVRKTTNSVRRKKKTTKRRSA